MDEKLIRAEKMVQVAKATGFLSVENQQWTNRSVYDTVAAAGQNVFRFFADFANKTLFQTNLTQGRLDSAEMLCIDEIVLDGALDAVLADGALLTVRIGNDIVLDKWALKYDATGAGFSTFPVKTVSTEGSFSFPLRTSIVIPAAVEFSCELEFAAAPGAGSVTLTLAGIGTLLKAQTAY